VADICVVVEKAYAALLCTPSYSPRQLSKINRSGFTKDFSYLDYKYEIRLYYNDKIPLDV
jgi:hypothetical protein